MKKDKYKWTPRLDVSNSGDNAEQERFGFILANRLNRQHDTSESCISAEEMSILLEARVTGEEKDRMMRHLSSCETCYEVYLLAADLHEDEAMGSEPKGKSLIFYKPMALAASVLIVIFSLYIFYKSNDIPKTSRQLIEMTDTAVEEKVALSPAAKPTPEMYFNNVQEEKPMDATESEIGGGAGIGPDTLRERAKAVEKKIMAERRQRGGRHVETEKRESTLKLGAVSKSREMDRKDGQKNVQYSSDSANGNEREEGKVKNKMDSSVENKARDKENVASKADDNDADYVEDKVAAKVEANAAGEINRESTANESRKKRESTVPRFQSQKQMRQQPINVNVQQNVVAPQAVQEPPASEETPQTGSVVGVQQKLQAESVAITRVEQLNRVARSSSSYMSFSQLLALFNETWELAGQLKEQGELAVSDSQSRFQPLIKVASSDQIPVVFPNIEYFLSKSQPNSVGYQFFSLLLSGWCDGTGQCYGKDGLVPAWDKKLENRKELLQLWETLYPQLTGVFKEIATFTMQRLKN